MLMYSTGGHPDTLATRAWWLPIIEERILQTTISQTKLNSSTDSRRDHEKQIGENLSRLDASEEIDRRIFGNLTHDGHLREKNLNSKSSDNGENGSPVKIGSNIASAPSDRSAQTSRAIFDTKATRSKKDLVVAYHPDIGGSLNDNKDIEASSHKKNQAKTVAVDDGSCESSPHVSKAGSFKGSPKTQRRRERRRGKLPDRLKDQVNSRDTNKPSVAASPLAKSHPRDSIPNSTANIPSGEPTSSAELESVTKHFDTPRSDIKTPGEPGSNLRERVSSLEDASITQSNGVNTSAKLNLSIDIPASIGAKSDSIDLENDSKGDAVTQIITSTKLADTLNGVRGILLDQPRPAEPDSDLKEEKESVAEYMAPSILLNLIQEPAGVGTDPPSPDRYTNNIAHKFPEMVSQKPPEGLEANADTTELSASSTEQIRVPGDSIDAITPINIAGACCTKNPLSNEIIHDTSEPCWNECAEEAQSDSPVRKNFKGLNDSDHNSASDSIYPGFTGVAADHSANDLPRDESTQSYHGDSSEDLPDHPETPENSKSDSSCSSDRDFTEDEASRKNIENIPEDGLESESSGTDSGYDTDENSSSDSSEDDTYTLSRESEEVRKNRNLEKSSPLITSGVMGLIWTYATHTPVDRDLLRAGIWLFERAPNYYKSQPYVYRRHDKELEQAPVVIRTSGDRSASLHVRFDGEVLYISTHGTPWPDMRSKHSHPDMLPVRRLIEYQAAESMGLNVWRHDRNLLECRFPSCKCKLSDVSHSTIICAGCGPKSITRYCSVEHQVLDLKMHWRECGHRKLIIKRVIDKTTEPARFKHLCPAIRDCKNIRSFAKSRQNLYSRLTHGRYTLFNPRTGYPTVLVWSRKDPSFLEMEIRVERLLNCALFDQRNKSMVTFLFRMVRKCLQSKKAFSPGRIITLQQQFKAEFGLDASRIESDEVCECEWEGENLAEDKHLPNCRKLYRNFSPQFRKTGMRGYLEMYEKRYWILRVWQQQHQSVTRWRDRVAGKGFPDGVEGKTPSLGPGFVCWGAKENDSCL